MTTKTQIIVTRISILRDSILWSKPNLPPNNELIEAYSLWRKEAPDRVLYIVFTKEGRFRREDDVLFAPLIDVPQRGRLEEKACELFISQGY